MDVFLIPRLITSVVSTRISLTPWNAKLPQRQAFFVIMFQLSENPKAESEIEGLLSMCFSSEFAFYNEM